MGSPGKTHWRAENAAEEAGRMTLTSRIQQAPSSLQSSPVVAQTQIEDKYVDISFLDEIPTGLELLDDCDILYVREIFIPESQSASVTEMIRKEKAFEILDHNGERLYFVVSRKKLSSPFMALSWYDFFGNEVLKTSGKFGLWDCSGRMEVQIPSEHTDDDLMDGYVKQGCKLRPTYQLRTVDDVSYTFMADRSQWVCCSRGPHAPHDFEILDPEFNDLVGTIYKIKGDLEFGHVDYISASKSQAFQGFAVHIMSQEMGAPMKAMMICGGFLLNKQHFQRQNCCGCHFGCLSALVFLLLLILVTAIGLFGLSSFFEGNRLAEVVDREEMSYRKVERTDGGGQLAFAEPSKPITFRP